MTWILLAALLWQLVDFLRELADFKNQKSPVVTQATAWIAGIIVAFLAAHAGVTADIAPPGFTQTFSSMDTGSLILVGLLGASLASTGVDLKQGFDNSDSAAKPPLIGPPPGG